MARSATAAEPDPTSGRRRKPRCDDPVGGRSRHRVRPTASTSMCRTDSVWSSRGPTCPDPARAKSVMSCNVHGVCVCDMSCEVYTPT